MAEALFRAYFIDGANITDRAVLADIGASAGLERAALAEWLAGEEGLEAVLGNDLSARQGGIGGVPFFIINRRIGVSGAQPAEHLLEAMREALKATAQA